MEYVCVCVHGVLRVGSLIISGEERFFLVCLFCFCVYYAFEVTMHDFPRSQ